LTKILARDLEEEQVSSLAEFMKARSSGHFVLRGRSIEVKSLANPKVKFLLNKFLHTNHLSRYRVFDTAGTFEIVSIKPEKKRTEKHETLKRPTSIWVPIHPPPTAIEPSLVIEWQGQPPRNKIRSKRK